MLLTRYGLKECVIITIVAAIAAAIFSYLALWWAIGLTVVIWLALLAFFRDPPRHMPNDLPEGAMLSPADGTVSAIERFDHHEAVDGPAVIVRIFLSILNVHVNRSPCEGEVVSIEHRPGKYLDARTEQSAKVNESNLMVLRRPDGNLIGVRQVSGAVARRIVCDVRIGDRLRRGQRYGMIKFGSTTELILPHPDRVTVSVTKGDRVKGALTLLATLGPADKPTGDGERTGTDRQAAPSAATASAE